MKTAPIVPAQVDFAGVPRSALYGDVYHPPIGALQQAQHVFLRGNRLPARWAGRAQFTVLETGFGLGNNFLATWQAWRDDPQRCERLCFVSIERHPLTCNDLARAHAASPLPLLRDALLQAWPPLTPNLHMLDFEGGRVQLLLALGDVAQLLPELQLRADAFFLDGFAPARNPDMWQPRVIKALGRKAAPGATLATWSVARELRDSLTAAGFQVQRQPGIGGKFAITVATFAPTFSPRSAPTFKPHAAMPADQAPPRHAMVIGAGIAGAAMAQALLRHGMQVTVLERHAVPAAETSGNPAGLFHGTVHAGDGPHARLFRAAALQAQREYAAAIRAGVPGNAQGLLRLGDALAPMQALLAAQGLPADYVQALDAQAASQRAAVVLSSPAWFYPGGGWIDPAAWVQRHLAAPGVRLIGGAAVARIARDGDGVGWAAFDAAGSVLARAPVLVLANAAQAATLLAPLGQASWPLSHSRGQVSWWADASGWAGALPRLPLAGDGYALPLPGGGLLCGASREPGIPAAGLPPLDQAAHQHNLQRLQQLTGLVPPAHDEPAGRAGWRLETQDRLPLAGALPLPAALQPPGQRRDQARLLPRETGLFVLSALGARSLTLAPLLARLIAAQASGAPWPLEQSLADAVDPARWLVRAARQAQAERPAADSKDASGAGQRPQPPAQA